MLWNTSSIVLLRKLVLIGILDYSTFVSYNGRYLGRSKNMKCKSVFFNLSRRSMAGPWARLLEDQADIMAIGRS